MNVRKGKKKNTGLRAIGPRRGTVHGPRKTIYDRGKKTLGNENGRTSRKQGGHILGFVSN